MSKPMTHAQQMACLYWVEFMLSGKYKHGKVGYYNHETGCHSAIGVAMASQHRPTNEDGYFLDCNYIGFANERQWFDATFNLPRDPDVYVTLSSMSTDYIPVAALVLHAVPDSNRRKAIVFRKLMEKETTNGQQKTRS